MSLVHICTNESLLAGAKEFEMQCHICDIKAMQKIGYVSGFCSHCKQHYELEGWCGYIVYLRRQALGLKRREFAEMMGIKRKTLANCETSVCSKTVYDKSLVIFKQLFVPNAGIERVAEGDPLE